MQNLNRRNQGGFSLVEILLVLGIIAILAIAAFIIFPQVQAANRANAEQTNITTLTAGIKNLYGATRDYDSITNTVVNQARIAPPTMNGGTFTGGTLTSSWSEAVTIAPSAAVAANPGPPATPAIPAGRAFTITYASMPSEICTRLVPGLLQNFDQIAIDGTAVATNDPAAIVTACNGAADVDVEFTSQ